MPNRQQVLQFLATLFNGAITGAVLWLLLDMLGVFRLAGLSGLGHLHWAAAGGAVLAVIRLRKLLWLGIIAAMALIAVIAYTPVMRPLVHGTVRRDSLKSPYDAVVALSSGVNADGFLDSQGTDRLLTALDLAERGASKNLVITSFRSNAGGKKMKPDTDQRWLIALASDSGQLRPSVFTADMVVNTHDEALRVKELAKSQKWNRVVVVTSPIHTRRACAAFEKVGLTVTCVPSRSTEPATSNLIGYGDRLTAFQLWLYERIGWFEYWRRGWV